MAYVIDDACINCGVCAGECPVGAITVDRAEKSWSIDHETCIKCGACITGCPTGCLKKDPDTGFTVYDNIGIITLCVSRPGIAKHTKVFMLCSPGRLYDQ